MTGDRPYPDEVSGPFPAPPVAFEDREGRDIEIRSVDSSEANATAAEDNREANATAAEDNRDDVFDALVAMYDDFDASDRAQGLPPIGESRIRSWLDTLLSGEALNVVAWDGDSVAGHATLVPDGSGASELAIFVHQDYQGAGIGGELIECLLGYGASDGVEKVWLTVERWNRPAVGLYEKVGFETAEAESFELEMTLRLADSEESDGE